MFQYSHQIQDENSQKITLSMWLATNHMQNIGSLSGCQDLIGRQSPQFYHTKVSITQSLNWRDGGWGWLEQELLPDTECSMLFFAVSYFWVNLMFDLRVVLACGKRDHFDQWVIKCLNLNVGSCSLWRAVRMSFVSLDFLFYRKKIYPFILKYKMLHEPDSLDIDHCEIIRKVMEV